MIQMEVSFTLNRKVNPQPAPLKTQSSALNPHLKPQNLARRGGQKSPRLLTHRYPTSREQLSRLDQHPPCKRKSQDQILVLTLRFRRTSLDSSFTIKQVMDRNLTRGESENIKTRKDLLSAVYIKAGAGILREHSQGLAVSREN